MHISPEEVLRAVDEQKASLTRLSHQFNANEFKVVMVKSHALVALLQKLIAEHTKKREELVWKECGRRIDPTGWVN